MESKYIIFGAKFENETFLGDFQNIVIRDAFPLFTFQQNWRKKNVQYVHRLRVHNVFLLMLSYLVLRATAVWILLNFVGVLKSVLNRLWWVRESTLDLTANVFQGLAWKQLDTRCLKITEKVSFEIASEASYFYILSGQKFIKMPKNCQFWRVFKT